MDDQYLSPNSTLNRKTSNPTSISDSLSQALAKSRSEFIFDLPSHTIEQLLVPIRSSLISRDTVLTVRNPASGESLEIDVDELLQILESNGISTGVPEFAAPIPPAYSDYRNGQNVEPEEIAEEDDIYDIIPDLKVEKVENRSGNAEIQEISISNFENVEIQKNVTLPLPSRQQSEVVKLKKKYLIILLGILLLLLLIGLAIVLAVVLSGGKKAGNSNGSGSSSSTATPSSSSTGSTTIKPATHQILLFGGAKNGGAQGRIQTFNPSNPALNSYLPQNLTIPTYGGAVGLVENTVILAAGYLSGNRAGNSVQRYNTLTGEISISNSYPINAVMLSGAVLADTLFCCGGFSPEQTQAFASCYASSAKENYRWTQISPMMRGRGALALVALDSKLFAIGGVNSIATETMEIYDSKAAVPHWNFGPSMGDARHELAATDFNGTIVACGGMGKAQYTLSSCEQFDVKSNYWKSFPGLNIARQAFSLLNFDGKLVALGGTRKYGRTDIQVSEVELFDPTVGWWKIISNIYSSVYAPFGVVV